MRRRLISILATGLIVGLLTAAAAPGAVATAASKVQSVLVTNTSDQPVPVAGTVSVGNLPATQKVAGTVKVGNLPATQQVSGTVGIDPNANTVSVDLSDATIATTASQTQTEVDETVTLDGCTFHCMMPPEHQWTIEVADYDTVTVSAYWGRGCDQNADCATLTLYRKAPSGAWFLLDEVDLSWERLTFTKTYAGATSAIVIVAKAAPQPNGNILDPTYLARDITLLVEGR